MARPEHLYDVILVGGGVMGCATAYYLLRDEPRLRIAIIERDPSYARASTPLSDGNTRVQFNLPENIRMSQFGLTALATFADDMAVGADRPDVAFRQQGNLFLVDEAGEAEARAGLATQQALGCEVVWLSPAEVKQLFPLVALTGVVGGTFGRRDGTLSPWAVLLGYRNKAVALGAHFVPVEAAAVTTAAGRVTGARLASGEALEAPVVVNTAGPWAAALAHTAGVALPVTPVKRQVTFVETTARGDHILPCLFLPSGLYCIHEGGGHFMCGKSLPDDPVTDADFTWERERFEAHLWPELAEAIPQFDRLKILRGWAGLYEVNTLDGNAILGEWPELTGFFLANGFSGHGFQQCHAVGRHLAELITRRPPSLDLALFSPRRVLENRPAFENRRRLI